MPLFTLYDADTGQITATMEGTVQTAALNGSYIEGEYDADEYVIVDGVATRQADAEMPAKRDADALTDMKIRRQATLM